MIYLDYNATTPLDPRVAEVMVPLLTRVYGNPSSGHLLGREAREVMERAREEVAECLGCEPGEVFFTSGGSEANNWALRGVVDARGGGHVVVSAVEHPAILEPVRAMERAGRIRLTVVGVDSQGLVDPDKVAAALAADTILVSVMLANNEVGTVQPLAEIASRCRARNVLVHTDAAQAVGKIRVDMGELGVHMLSLAGHKLYAPKGVGVLVVRRGVAVEPMIRGAAHERGMRAGTENVAAGAGLGRACTLAKAELADEGPRLVALRDRLERALHAGFPTLIQHGHPVLRLPNTSSLAFPGADANLLLTRLADRVAASAGAACHTDSVTPSHVLAAMGVDTSTSMATVRFSVGRFSTESDVDEGAEAVLAVARELAGERSKPDAPGRDGGLVRLTRYTHGLGCACKLQPDVLERVLQGIPRSGRAEVLVGAETSDDACAWRLPDGSVLVQTVDFFTPIVDDPRLFGAIAAVNALSDIYAMGAEPMFALNIVAFPIAALPVSVLQEILAGAAEVAAEAGIPVLGGHTIEDTEPKFGWVATGMTTESRLWRNAGAKPGDLLVLTKPIGTGIWATAAKHQAAPAAGWNAVTASMRRLNAAAAAALRSADPRSVTDVTGFGLLGHLHEMLAASGTNGEVWQPQVPTLAGTRRLLDLGEVPGGTRSNLQHSLDFTTFEPGISDDQRLLLADAQTSGGLLAAVPETHTRPLLERLHRGGDVSAAVIGRVTGSGSGRITVTTQSS